MHKSATETFELRRTVSEDWNLLTEATCTICKAVFVGKSSDGLPEKLVEHNEQMHSRSTSDKRQ
jgi:hypothetical protein